MVPKVSVSKREIIKSVILVLDQDKLTSVKMNMNIDITSYNIYHSQNEHHAMTLPT